MSSPMITRMFGLESAANAVVAVRAAKAHAAAIAASLPRVLIVIRGYPFRSRQPDAIAAFGFKQRPFMPRAEGAGRISRSPRERRASVSAPLHAVFRPLFDARVLAGILPLGRLACRQE